MVHKVTKLLSGTAIQWGLMAPSPSKRKPWPSCVFVCTVEAPSLQHAVTSGSGPSASKRPRIDPPPPPPPVAAAAAAAPGKRILDNNSTEDQQYVYS